MRRTEDRYGLALATRALSALTGGGPVDHRPGTDPSCPPSGQAVEASDAGGMDRGAGRAVHHVHNWTTGLQTTYPASRPGPAALAGAVGLAPRRPARSALSGACRLPHAWGD